MLCFLELIIAVEVCILSIFKFAVGYKFFEKNSIQCAIWGFFMQWLNRVEIVIVCILSTLRYLMRTFFFSYGAILGDAKPSSSYIQCHSFLGSDPFSTHISLGLSFCYLIPCWITTINYFLVGWNANKKLNVIKHEAKINNDRACLAELRKQKRKLLGQLIIVFILYNGFFMLSYVTMIMKYTNNYRRTPFVDAMVFTLITVSISLNPLITVSFQPDLNSEFLFFLVKINAKLKSMLKSITKIW
ncbi:hypothetical protein CONCODRAFT_13061 [Conidiobolus coronatus NRRL 28638]|uniref:G-protein coupled receptors family 1 profile domain-containing protein n=1 Tax=Conidiobolus coronatus (strain ATCC 28846 / CBS 209.66 / NRRL 28638) TaxID=796925 RepID=A0A137NRK1_CONC2|nr:hypothetical protein CONCODRAFT_13061 [Conidiobolus coronatus NRRL 28638]|eukprot:KXN65371.1 hypothetical protein CONCODRAFT_13061 [Conidiobolus coronatus NRRL 28638]